MRRNHIMSRMRGERMYLTKKYQNRQKRLHKLYHGPYVDEMRYYQDPLKSLMKSLLGIEILRLWGQKYPPSALEVSRWKYQSWKHCPCVMCRGPRHQPWSRHREQITQQERKSEDSYKAQLIDLYNRGWKDNA